jgi:transposase
VPDRAALTGIVFVLKTGTPWEHLPAEMGCGSGMTCWRRLRDWQVAGVWARLHKVLLDRLEASGRIRWDRAALDSTAVAAKKGAPRRAPTRRTVAGRAPSATWSQTPRAHRSA